MVAERLTISDSDERYRKDMEGGYRPEVIEAKRETVGERVMTHTVRLLSDAA
jgi:hypothetical protein